MILEIVQAVDLPLRYAAWRVTCAQNNLPWEGAVLICPVHLPLLLYHRWERQVVMQT